MAHCRLHPWAMPTYTVLDSAIATPWKLASPYSLSPSLALSFPLHFFYLAAILRVSYFQSLVSSSTTHVDSGLQD
ncbi:hypothetical protein CIPAW_02G058800 [Carya illinoinensis]|uniref:Uncharacterized protein n=1 Tax=Carya illinoinensis TaxID=32201 RepID=A0A8T1R954_CARIL|nr:hypothetical protein CIPAW_02G058800 [Carya illinoinensis]